MILPEISRLTIIGYGLFPGKLSNGVLDRQFAPGVTLIAGINGLGKTTILTAILRLLTGPSDLTGIGAPERLDSTIPSGPVRLEPQAVRFFSQRVSDGAEEATAQIELTFGRRILSLKRQLNDLSLVELTVDAVRVDLHPRKDQREADFQRILCELFNLGSFVNVLLAIHYLIFFTEGRTGALWDDNAQRHLLRAAFLDAQLVDKINESERVVQRSDSLARNLNTRVTSLQKQLDEALRREDLSPALRAELEIQQKLLDADLARKREIEDQIASLDLDRKNARNEYEQAKIEREDSESAVDRFKYTALLRLFPSMEDATRLALVRLSEQQICPYCGNPATADARRDLESLLASGVCPICRGGETRNQSRVTPVRIEPAQLRRARVRAERARSQEEVAKAIVADTSSRYGEALDGLTTVDDAIRRRRENERRLSAQLPPASDEIRNLQQAVDALKTQQREAEAERAAWSRKLQGQLVAGQSAITSRSAALSRRFALHIKTLLPEQARLVQVRSPARLIQSKVEEFFVPAFAPEMTSADHAGYSRRYGVGDVSQSQRELVDLAFRLALIDVSTGGKSCTLLLETPEASLDGLAMLRVGSALHKFATTGSNRLIITSNLASSGIITELFGGPTKSRTEINKRRGRVLNLLEVAAPNRAVERDKRRYERLLLASLSGRRP